MRKKRSALIGIFAAVLLAGCAKEVPDSEKINDILAQQTYMRVRLGESYHQSEVQFDLEGEKAVVPENAKWGLPQYREGHTIGMSFAEEGTDIFQGDAETNPELYPEMYWNTIRHLALTAKEVKDSNYHVKVAGEEELQLFEQELASLSGMVVSDGYELSGVGISFDKECRPVKKTFQFRKKAETDLGKEEEDSARCTQEFSYDIGKMRFSRAFGKVRKLIEEGN